MSIITLSRRLYSRGEEIAEKVAEQLGYECLSREVLLEASTEFNVPEIKLLHAIRDAPSILERFTHGKEKYLAYIRVALLEHFQRDNVVYHGLAGHFLVKDISHVLKVRIVADVEDRVQLAMEREGISRDEALRAIHSSDEARRKWSLYITGVDTNDPSLYHLVIRIRKLSPDDAAAIICHTVKKEQFHTTPASQRAMEDLLLATRVKAALVDEYPTVEVEAREGAVQIALGGARAADQKAVQQIAAQVPGVKQVTVAATAEAAW
ncbi:MAG TPA: cytidylate kinase-like family protein [Planctomycetaceae bacterium]|nr:cytidylate kinase-like family protein [Planctomycetaceae bacterium]HIQ21868.1 cytidylate kinase-like family protein [Planctomycetota bacterium]